MDSVLLDYVQQVNLKMIVQRCWHSSRCMCLKFGVKEMEEGMGKGMTIQHTN